MNCYMSRAMGRLSLAASGLPSATGLIDSTHSTRKCRSVGGRRAVSLVTSVD